METKICHLVLYLCLVLSILRLSDQLLYSYIYECPSSLESRIKHSVKLNCTWQSSVNVYHCLPTKQNLFLEFCYQETALQGTDGCPFVTVSNGAIHIKQKQCEDIEPSCQIAKNNDKIFSSEIFKYSRCLPIAQKNVGGKHKVSREFSTESIRRISTSNYKLEQATSRIHSCLDSTSMEKGQSVPDEKSLTSKLILILGIILFPLMSVFIGFVLCVLFKRTKALRNELEDDNCMANMHYSASTAESQLGTDNERVYECVDDVDDITPPHDESNSKGKRKLCCV